VYKQLWNWITFYLKIILTFLLLTERMSYLLLMFMTEGAESLFHFNDAFIWTCSERTNVRTYIHLYVNNALLQIVFNYQSFVLSKCLHWFKYIIKWVTMLKKVNKRKRKVRNNNVFIYSEESESCHAKRVSIVDLDPFKYAYYLLVEVQLRCSFSPLTSPF